MSTLQFDRDALGVSAKSDWHDSEIYSSLAFLLREFWMAGTAPDPPAVSHHGPAELRAALGEAQHLAMICLNEFSDACAVLGSGQQEAMEDYDETERQVSAHFNKFAATLNIPGR